MQLELVRHGESRAKVGEDSPQDIGDHEVELTARGHVQVEASGRGLGASLGVSASMSGTASLVPVDV